MNPNRHELVDAAMLRAIELAKLGPLWGANPRVGCVILDSQGNTLAEGYHRGAGTAHAEVDALSQLSPEQTQGATAIVTLEPCNHTGRTGPCARALIAAGIAEVHYAVADPGKASANGAATLEAAGVKTSLGPRSPEAAELNHAWFVALKEQRPYIILKWASTLDGRIAAANGSSQWITGPDARADVHRRRANADAIAVGTGTALADDPSLTARTPENTLYPHQPLAVVVGNRHIPDNAKLHRHPAGLLEHHSHDIESLLEELQRREVRTLFVEGGTGLISAFLRAGYGDELLVYLAPKLLGGPMLALNDLGISGIDQALDFSVHRLEQLGNDVLIVSRQTSLEGK
ncbi:MAG: bifunctional diaminohydroxyphosphoribosylaminopyrimidine deaminase/5-amino-6-(5-phosphoribosylamino)uracil reductase RibD [Microbacteriaceae bacterium]